MKEGVDEDTVVAEEKIEGIGTAVASESRDVAADPELLSVGCRYDAVITEPALRCFAVPCALVLFFKRSVSSSCSFHSDIVL